MKTNAGGAPSAVTAEKTNQARKDRFERMEADAGREIAGVVAVMGPMDPPQPVDAVQQIVLSIGHQIQRHDRQDDAHPLRQRDVVHEPDAVLLAERGAQQAECRKHRLHEDRAEDGKAEIARPSQPERIARGTTRDDALEQSDDDNGAEVVDGVDFRRPCE